MQSAIVIKGRLVGPRNVELDEPVLNGKAEVEVEVILRSRPEGPSVSQFLQGLATGTRSKADIDKQIHDERQAWGETR